MPDKKDNQIQLRLEKDMIKEMMIVINLSAVERKSILSQFRGINVLGRDIPCTIRNIKPSSNSCNAKVRCHAKIRDYQDTDGKKRTKLEIAISQAYCANLKRYLDNLKCTITVLVSNNALYLCTNYEGAVNEIKKKNSSPKKSAENPVPKIESKKTPENKQKKGKTKPYEPAQAWRMEVTRGWSHVGMNGKVRTGKSPKTESRADAYFQQKTKEPPKQRQYSSTSGSGKKTKGGSVGHASDYGGKKVSMDRSFN